VFKRGTKRQIRGFRLRELEARDLTYIAPIAQNKSEILSQGFPSLQISRPLIVASNRFERPSSLLSMQRLTMKVSRLMVPNTDSTQIEAASGRGCVLPVADAAVRQRLSLAGQVLLRLEIGFFKGCFGSLCCKGFSRAVRGVLKV
jgi:hypothetical protein